MILEAIMGAYGPEDRFELKLRGFLMLEPQRSKSLFEHMSDEDLVANSYPAEKRHSLALNIVLEYAELLAKGQISPGHYVQDIIKVRKAGADYTKYLMICYAKGIANTLAYVYRLATNAKKEGKLHIKSSVDLNVRNAPLAVNVDKMVVLDRLSRYFSSESISTVASRVSMDEIEHVKQNGLSRK